MGALLKRRWNRLVRPYGRRRTLNPLKWRGRDRLLVGGELLAFVSAIAAIPADILGLGIASWLLTGAAMVGTLAILLYAVDVITSGDTMFGVSLT